MARKRSKSRKSSRRRRGMGNILTVRRAGMRGLADFKKIDAGSAILPILIGGGLTALTVAGIRYATVTSTAPVTEGQQKLYRFASAAGLGVGVLASGALFAFSGASAAVSAATASFFVAATGVVHDWYSANYPVSQAVMLADMASSPRPTEPQLVPPSAAAAAAATATTEGLGYYGGARRALRQNPRAAFGAVVAEPVNGIVLESTRGLGATVDSQYGGGYEVNLGAVNTGAFGTPGFKV